MTFWKRLKQWEIHIEKGPKLNLLRLVALCFSLSVVTGFTISQSMVILSTQAAEKQLQEIRMNEKQHMNERINELKKLRYEETHN